MSEMHPPRGAQMILESLGASPEFRDPIIGDMAQEYADRIGRVGEKAARLWYYKEVFRSAPHFVRNWSASVKGPELRQLIAVLGYAYILTLLAEFLLVMIVGLPLAATGMSNEPVVGAIMLSTLAVVSPIFAGFAAASLYGKAPIIAAAAFGLVIMTVTLASIAATSFMRQGPVPESFRLAVAVTASFGAVYGGTIRVRVGDRFARWIVA
jgi:hypothetical protein